MAAPSTYLYGDSTPSPLKTDFIAFLRDAFDFSVQVLLCDSRLTDAAQHAVHLADATEADVGNAEAFATEVLIALDRINVGLPESIAARCAARLRQSVSDAVRTEMEAARANAQAAKARAAHTALGERESCLRAFEALVLRHALPESTPATKLTLENTATYTAHASAATAYGLAWVVALEIPASHPLARVLRLERIVERLEIGAPEEAGWLHKEVKVRPQRFDRLHLTELALYPAETRMKLRASPEGEGIGFDVTFLNESGAIDLRRVLDSGPSPDAYRVDGEDVAKLQSLRESLTAMALDLGDHKKSLVRASLDDTPLQELETPRVLVERLIGNIAPTVQQIARRTLSPGELVLKRLVKDNQREEVFLSKAELEGKVAPLSAALRRAFDPLELWSDAAPRPEIAPRARESTSTASRIAGKLTPLPRPAAAPRAADSSGKDLASREGEAVGKEIGESSAPVIERAPDVNMDVASPASPASPAAESSLPTPDLGDGAHPYAAPAPIPSLRSSRPPRP
jgi:hypothetical protein